MSTPDAQAALAGRAARVTARSATTAARMAAAGLNRAHPDLDAPRRYAATMLAARYAVRRAQETRIAARRARRQEADAQAARDALRPQPGAVWHEHDPAGECPPLCAGHTFRDREADQ